MKRKIHQGNLDLARQIRAAGIRVHIGEDDEEAPHDSSSGLLIYQADGVVDSRAFDFHGATGYIIDIVITFNISRFAIARFDLELPWNGPFRWLDKPVELVGQPAVYRFGGDYDPQFEMDEVLNHRTDVRRIWSRRDSLKGVLLGIGDEPIPDQFQHGSNIPALLTVYDQFWQKFCSSISLWADRSEKLRPARSVIARRGRLFDCPDPRREHVPLEEDEKKK
jgi:hypothetical protein